MIFSSKNSFKGADDTMNFNERKFAPTHEWAAVDGDIATIGISDFAVKALTDLVFLDLPAVGQKLETGEMFGEVESVKAVSELLSPVSGEVIAVNSAIVDNLSTLVSDPFGNGWLVKIRMSDTTEFSKLLDLDAYRKQCAEEH